VAAVLLFVCVPIVGTSGCINGDLWYAAIITGRIVDSETGDPLTDFAISGCVFLEGRELQRSPQYRFEGTHDYPFTGGAGEFELEIEYAWIGYTQTLLGTSVWTDWPDGEPHPTTYPGPEILPPDQFELTVVAGECEHVFLIQLGENLLTQEYTGTWHFELEEPILVGVCDD
jgi:hypothetical protein